jgi:hypothetical protein
MPYFHHLILTLKRLVFMYSDGELYQQPTDLSGVGLAPAAVAQQLTHIELQHLSFIGRPQAHHHSRSLKTSVADPNPDP